MRTFAELDLVAKAENIVFIGPPGVAKTGIASGLLLKALQNGHRGLFVRAQDLFDEMYASLADRSSRKLIDRLARVDVLVVDELGYLNLKPEQTNIFFKLMLCSHASGISATPSRSTALHFATRRAESGHAGGRARPQARSHRLVTSRC
jgi:DNA replication protein DnaC